MIKVDNEYISPDIIRNIIKANRHLVTHRGESFGYNVEVLAQIIIDANIPIDDPNVKTARQKVVKRASRLMAGITYHQPFNNGNKATAFVITKHYLRKNGFKLILQTKNDEKELFDLLHMVSMKFEGQSITKEIESYLESLLSSKYFRKN